MNKTEDFVIDLAGLGKAILKRWYVVIISAVLCGAAALGFAIHFIEPTYESFFTAYINNSSSEEIGSISSSDISASEYLTDTYAIILTSRNNVENAIEKTNLSVGYDDIDISVSSLNDTQVIKVTVESNDPNISYLICDSLEVVSAEYVEEIISGSSMKIITSSEYSDEIASPSYVKVTASGIVAGIIVSLLILFIVFMCDTKIKTKDELSETFNIPVLGIIHDMSKSTPEGYGYYGKGRR